tara:strand:- start:2500 stop:4929 length:2430 start_codon:yes stop_codon:yes gene_type:complete
MHKGLATKDVKDALENQEDHRLNTKELKDIVSSLSSYTYISRELQTDPTFFEKEIKAYPHDGKVVFPCFLIELRDILDDEVVSFPNKIPLFSLRFAERHLSEYPLFLLLNLKAISCSSKGKGGIVIFDSHELNIKDAILKVLLNMPAARTIIHSTKKVIKDTNFKGELLFHNNIPGVSNVHVATKKTAQGNIPLTSQEEAIFNLLRETKKKARLNVQMLVAGGWVRDKLLGKQSDDIDIAVDMPGYNFARLIYETARSKEVREPHKVSLEKSADPEAREPSDDLMVGGIYIYGQKIEFVPMRTEHYPDPNSRTPAITNTNDPKEDVKRRDLTINAMYYNVDTGQVEDYVGGYGDLGLDGSGVINLRTPDDPVKTFTEDPLRVLRVLRFYSRYGNSQIDPKIIEAMQLPEVKEAYVKKVAPERAGPEIIKMLQGEKPAAAVRVLFETDLYKQAFDVPEMQDLHEEGIRMDQKTKFHKFNLMEHTLQVVENLNAIMKEKGEDDDMRGIMNLAAVLHDFGKMKAGIQQPNENDPERMSYLGHEDESALISESVLKSIGIGKNERDIVNQVVSLHMEPHSADQWSNKARGKFLRRTKMPGKEEEHKDLWKYIFYHAQADAMSSNPENYDEEGRQNTFNQLNEYVESPVAEQVKPVLDGNEVMTLIPELHPKTGFIRDINAVLLEMQNEGVVDKEVAKQKVLEMKPELLQKYQTQAKSMNWFKNAQSVVDNYINPVENEEGIKKYPPGPPFGFEVGMKVRDRRQGVALPQEYGIVKRIDNGKMEVEWSDTKRKDKKQVFDMDDTVAIYKILAEV